MSSRWKRFQPNVVWLAVVILAIPRASLHAAPAPRDTLTFYGELTTQAGDVPITGNVDINVVLYDDATAGTAL